METCVPLTLATSSTFNVVGENLTKGIKLHTFFKNIITKLIFLKKYLTLNIKIKK